MTDAERTRQAWANSPAAAVQGPAPQAPPLQGPAPAPIQGSAVVQHAQNTFQNTQPGIGNRGLQSAQSAWMSAFLNPYNPSDVWTPHVSNGQVGLPGPQVNVLDLSQFAQYQDQARQQLAQYLNQNLNATAQNPTNPSPLDYFSALGPAQSQASGQSHYTIPANTPRGTMNPGYVFPVPPQATLLGPGNAHPRSWMYGSHSV